jgi:hypothetical protein
MPSLAVVERLPSTSSDPLYAWVEGYADPTGQSVSYAIIPAGLVEPLPGDYKPAVWVTDPVTPNTPAVPGTSVIPAQKGRWLVRLPQGPGTDFPLDPGSRYEVFVKLALDGGVHLVGVVRTL